jgi:hypothetical protein
MKLGMIKRAAKAVIDIVHLTSKDEDEAIVNAFQGGALWLESKAWELASRRLPEIDREVVVLADISIHSVPVVYIVHSSLFYRVL